MTIKLGALKGTTKDVEVSWEGEVAVVTYRPGAMTVDSLDAVQQHAGSDRGDKAMVALLSTVLVAWDVLDDDGEPLGTDEASLNAMPIGFLSHVMNKVQEDMAPSGEASGPSLAG